MSLKRRFLPATALLLALAGCASGGGDSSGPTASASTSESTSASEPSSSTPAGILAETDLPFEPTSAKEIGRAGPLTDATSSCLGTELQVLFDQQWTVKAREYADAKQWVVVSAIVTPPKGAPDAGIDLVRARAQTCMTQEQQAKVTPLQLGGASYGYEIDDAAGAFDSARAYLRLEGGRLAQITVESMPSGQRATEVLKDLVASLVK